MYNHRDHPWLSEDYSSDETALMLALLKNFTDDAAETTVPETFLGAIARIVFEQQTLPQASIPIEQGLQQLPLAKQHDFLLFALMLSLCATQGMKRRLGLLMAHWQEQFQVSWVVKPICEALLIDDSASIKSPLVLGEAYQNTITQINGIKSLGIEEYSRQMRCMKQGEAYPALEEKYRFLNSLSQETLGGQLCQMLRSAKLTLPGEPHGFAEFFLWHDLSHLLSGNGTDYKGELGTNSFTAAYSQYEKHSILLFGLLQFNLGHDLAVVAHPSRNKFDDPAVIEIYLHSLLSGCRSKLDLLHWPLDEMYQALSQPISAVREQFDIVPL